MNNFVKAVKETYDYYTKERGWEITHIIIQDDNFAIDLYDTLETFMKEYESADFEDIDFTVDYEDNGIAIQLFFQFF